MVKECPNCWWDVRRCHSALQEKDLPLQDLFGVWFEVLQHPTALLQEADLCVPGELCCSAGVVGTVKIIPDCPILLQSHKLDWKGQKSLFASTGTIAIFWEKLKEWKELVKYVCKNTPKHFPLHFLYTYSSFFFRFRKDRSKMKAILS